MGLKLADAVDKYRGDLQPLPSSHVHPFAPMPGAPEDQDAPIAIDWSRAPLAKAFPTWGMFHAALAEEREAAKREGRPPHPVALRPKLPPLKPQSKKRRGMTVEQAKRQAG